MTKITLETEHGAYSVEIDDEDMSVNDVFSRLMIPVMLSAGYDEYSIKEQLAD